jgi:hypothetical protein
MPCAIRFRFRYVLHPFAAKYSHWMWHKASALGGLDQRVAGINALSSVEWMLEFMVLLRVGGLGCLQVYFRTYGYD